MKSAICLSASRLTVNVTTAWTRFASTDVLAAGTTYPLISNESGIAATVFAWGAQLNEGDVALPYTATTTTAAAGTYTLPGSGGAKGVLIEEQRTNLLTRSSEFNDAAWSKVGVTVAADAAIAPDGTPTADLLTSTPSVNSYASSAPTYANSTTYTQTVYAKAVMGTGVLAFELRGGVNNGNASFNLGTGVASVDGNLIAPSADMTHVGNGWYRCRATYTTDATGTPQLFLIYIAVYGNTPTATTIALWGAQLELGAFATSYIPTTTAQVTRPGDVLSIGASDAGYRADQGTWVVDFYAAAAGAINGRLITLSPLVNGAPGLYTSTSSLTRSTLHNVTDVGNVGTTPGAVARVAYSYTSGNHRTTGGAAVALSTFVQAQPSATAIALGANPGGSAHLNSHLSRVRYWNGLLSDTNLVKLTAAATARTYTPSFAFDLRTGALPSQMTFSRASTGSVTDYEGVVRQAAAGEIRIDGLRRVANLLTRSQDFLHASWIRLAGGGGTAPTLTANYGEAPDGTMTATRFQATVGAGHYSYIYSNPSLASGRTRRNSIWMRSRSGTVKISFGDQTNQYARLTVGEAWTRFDTKHSNPTSGPIVTLILDATLGDSPSADMLIWGAQMEDVTGRSDDSVSEYVSTGVLPGPLFHGAGVDGVRYFNTDKEGAALSLNEARRRNTLIWSEDFSNAVWLKDNGGSGTVTLTPNAGFAPDGTLTAARVQFSGASQLVRQAVHPSVLPIGGICSGSIWFKGTAGQTIDFAVGGTGGLVTLTGAWQYAKLENKVAVNQSLVVDTYSGATARDVLIWHPQQDLGAVAGAYVRTRSQPASRVPFLGALIEEQRTNFALQSADFSAAAWAKSNVVAALDSTVLSPDGTPANKITVQATTFASLTQGITGPGSSAGNTYTIYARRGSGDVDGQSFLLRNSTTSVNVANCAIDYGTGVLTTYAGTCTATAVGNGWWRIRVTATTGISNGDALICYAGWTGGTVAAGTFAYLWGAQLEAGAFPTSYIPTVASQVTRSGDRLYSTGAGLAGFVNNAQGTLLAEMTMPEQTPAMTVCDLSDTGDNRTALLYKESVGPAIYAYRRNAGAVAGSPAERSVAKAAITYGRGLNAASVNGAAAVSPAFIAAPPTPTHLGIGSRSYDGGNAAGGYVRSFAYYREAIPAALLPSYTA